MILVMGLFFSNTYAVVDSATYSLPPLKQVKQGINSEYVVCKQGLQLMNKKEDDSPACVTLSTFSTLLSRGWGFDPSKEWTFDGLNETYKVGEQIIFGIKFQGFGFLCFWPKAEVTKENKTVWTGNLVALSCPLVQKSRWSYFEQEWKTGHNSNLGELVINQTGTYTVKSFSPYIQAQQNITITP